MSEMDRIANFAAFHRVRCINPMGCSTTAITCGQAGCDGRLIAMTPDERAAERARIEAFYREWPDWSLPEGIDLG